MAQLPEYLQPQDKRYRWMPMKDVIWPKVDIEAKYSHKEGDFLMFLDSTLDTQVPYRNNAPKDTFIVMVKFIVQENGNIRNIEAETENGFGLEEEVIRVMKKSPPWIPGQISNSPVNSIKRQSIMFIVK